MITSKMRLKNPDSNATTVQYSHQLISSMCHIVEAFLIHCSLKTARSKAVLVSCENVLCFKQCGL